MVYPPVKRMQGRYQGLATCIIQAENIRMIFRQLLPLPYYMNLIMPLNAL